MILNPYRLTAVLDGDAHNLCRAMTTPPSVARATAISALITSLKSAGVWQKLDLFYMLGAATSQAALINWVKPANSLSATGSPTFAADRGYTGDGATAKLIGVASMNALANFSQNNAHIGYWSLTDVANNNYYDIGINDTTNALRLNARNASGSATGSINAAGAQSHAVADSLGHILHNRTGASATEMFKNASSLGTDTDASTSILSGAFMILANRSTSGTFSARQIMCAHAGASLSGAEITALYNAINTFKTHLGA